MNEKKFKDPHKSKTIDTLLIGNCPSYCFTTVLQPTLRVVEACLGKPTPLKSLVTQTNSNKIQTLTRAKGTTGAQT